MSGSFYLLRRIVARTPPPFLSALDSGTNLELAEAFSGLSTGARRSDTAGVGGGRWVGHGRLEELPFAGQDFLLLRVKEP